MSILLCDALLKSYFKFQFLQKIVFYPASSVNSPHDDALGMHALSQPLAQSANPTYRELFVRISS